MMECTETNNQGKPCGAAAMKGTNPPRCQLHSLSEKERIEQSRRGGRGKGRRELPLDWRECRWVLNLFVDVLTSTRTPASALGLLAPILTRQTSEEDELCVLLQRLAAAEPEPTPDRLERARQRLVELYNEGKLGLNQLPPGVLDS
jgi:hypothetical protein